MQSDDENGESRMLATPVVAKPALQRKTRHYIAKCGALFLQGILMERKATKFSENLFYFEVKI